MVWCDVAQQELELLLLPWRWSFFYNSMSWSFIPLNHNIFFFFYHTNHF